MSALDKVKASRESDSLGQRVAELGVQVEVMSKRVGELADETAGFLDELAEGRDRQVLDWNEAQAEAAEVWARGASAQLGSLSQRIEPLAQAMATLSDEARGAIADGQEASRQQAAHWLEMQNAAAQLQAAAAKRSLDAASTLREAASEARSAAGQWHGWMWVWVAFAGMAPVALLLIASWIWLPRGLSPVTQSGSGVLWLQLTYPAPAPKAGIERSTP